MVQAISSAVRKHPIMENIKNRGNSYHINNTPFSSLRHEN